MTPGAEREGSIPSYSYQQSDLAALKSSAAWLWLPAAAMAVSLGVSLPAQAVSPYSLPSSSGTSVNLSNGAYGGKTDFIINSGTVISNNGNAIVGPYPTYSWSVDNHGTVTSSTHTAVDLYGGTINNTGTGSRISGGYHGAYIAFQGTIFNQGSITGGTVGAELGSGGSLTNSGTASFIGGQTGVAAYGFSTILNEGRIVSNDGANGIGVSLIGSGTITNSGSLSYIGGGATGIKLYGSAVTVINAGTITGTKRGIYSRDGGSISNSGIIQGGTAFLNSGIYLKSGGSVTNSGTGSIITGFEGIVAKDFATIFNQGSITANGHYGITLSNGGSITNSGTGASIHGDYFGIRSVTGALTVLNEGSITGGINGVLVNSGTVGGSLNLTNSGTASYINGVASYGATTIVNEGAIASSNGHGIYVYGAAGDTTLITNGGTSNTTATIQSTSSDDGIHLVNVGTIINSGIIQGGTSGTATGIYLDSGGSVTNSGTGSRISGYYAGIHANIGALTIVNEGSIVGGAYGVVSSSLNLTNSGTSSYITGVRSSGATTIVNEGVILGLHGSGIFVYGLPGYTSLITNSGTSSTIIGYSNGISSSGGALTVMNEGTITGGNVGISNAGTNVGSLNVTNSGITSYIKGVQSYGATTIVNEGVIANPNGNGIFVYGRPGDATLITNRAGAIVEGLFSGIYLMSAGTITNSGTIVGVFAPGIYLAHGGEVSNLGTASAIAGGAGIVAYGSLTLTNQGYILGHTYGVQAGDNSIITNSGTIVTCGCGSNTAVQLVGTGLVVTNSGTASVIAAGGYGVSILGQGSVHNEGTIIGAVPVSFTDIGAPGNNTVFNSGAITSINGAGGVAVQFGAGNDRLILAQGYSFTGTVQGGAGTNTLEVFSGPANFAMLSDPEFVGFTQLQVDAGATFSFTGPPDIPAGIGFINSGTFANTGTLTIHGTFTNIGTFTNSGSVIGDDNGITNAGGVLTNTGTITGTNNDGVILTGGTLNNTGVVKGGKYGVVVGAGAKVNNSGTILDDAIAGASLGSGASLTNNAGSTLAGVTGVVFTGTGASLTNMGTITGSGGVAIQFDAGANSATLATGSVLNGSIDGGGGAGQIVLSGTNSQTNTIANFGAGSGLTVAAGASWTASGNWTIATVTNSGTLQPGTAAAPLKLTGNFTQTGAGTFKALLGGTGAQLQVTGTAALDGNVLVVPPGTVMAPTKYTLISATGGVTGKFTGVTGGTALLSTDLSYDANDAYLSVGQRAVTSPIGVTETPNQLAAAGGFNAGLLANPAAFGAPLAQLNQLQAPAFIKALDQISGENLVDVSTAALLAQRQFIGQVMRQSRLTHGSDQEWSLWASGYGESGHLNGDGNAHRFNGGVSGAAAGADYRVSPSLRLGAAAGIGISHFNVAGANGTGRMAYKQVAGTASYDHGPLYVDAMLGGEFGDGSTRRDIVLPGLTSTAAGKVNSSQVMGSFEVGYGMSLEKSISLTPFARLETGEVDQNAFSETGAGILNLAAPAQSTSSTESLLGARFGTGMAVGGMLVDADFTLGWRHQLTGRGRSGRLSFAGVAGTDFTIAGAGLMGDAAELGLGLSTKISDTGAAWIHYDSDYASQGASQAITVGLRFAW